MDRRIRYTKMVLNESFIKFLEKKELSKITVTEICKDADINRSTYYSHFSDPFDQMDQLKSEILKDVTDFAKKIDTTRQPSWKRQYLVFKNILEYVEMKRNLFRILLSVNGNRYIQDEILTILGEKAFPVDTENKLSDVEKKHLLIYASNGCFGLFFHWLMDEHPMPPEQLAKLMADFTKNIMI